MKRLVRDAGLEERFEIASAATSAEELGNPVYPPAQRVLERHVLSCAGKTARQLVKSDYRAWDLIIGMDAENMRNMRRLFSGDPEGKVHLLLDYAGGGEIEDPWYTGRFDHVYRQIETGCAGLLSNIVQNW